MGTLSPEIIKFIKTFFVTDEQAYPPEKVKQLRRWLRMDQAEFGNLFFQSAEAVKAWETPETSDKHREVSGATARLMQLVEWLALDRNNRRNTAYEKSVQRAKLRGI